MEHRCTDDCSPDTCLKMKLAYWRKTGAPGIHLGAAGVTRNDWRELSSVAQRERDHVRELKASGIDFDRA